MNLFLEKCFEYNRVIISILIFLIIGGVIACNNMPKEATPDIDIPVVYVMVRLEGVSPEDAERILIKPLEKQLKVIEGVKNMRSQAVDGMASVTLEFEADFNKEKALQDVRDKVNIAKADFPADAKEPHVQEVSFSHMPVLIIGLAGQVPEYSLVRIGRDLRDKLEAMPSILEVDIGGDREDMVEILIHPEVFENYDLKMDEVMRLVGNNNLLVAAGTWDVGHGRMPFKVPGLYSTVQDIMSTPIKVKDDKVVSFSDIASIRKRFKDSTGIARMNGKSAITLYVKKRVGQNIVDAIKDVRHLVEKERRYWPENIEVEYMDDQSKHIKDQLTDLANSLLIAVVLVMGVVVRSLGFRSALLVGISIPGSFLAGLWVMYVMGVSINNVVLFSLILAVGMLVDGAVIVTEFADRKMSEGVDRKRAYLLASQRMIMPVIGSTATSIAAFLPMLFWPGIVGKFMQYLPITLVCTLTASLLMALIFVPTLGALMGKPGKIDPVVSKKMELSETGDIMLLGGWTGKYLRILSECLKRPGSVLLLTTVLFIVVYFIYAFFGRGIEFFPNVEPDRIAMYVRMRGDMGVNQVADTVKKVEGMIQDIPGIKNIYTATNTDGVMGGVEMPEDTRGVIEIEFLDWDKRPTVDTIVQQMETMLSEVPGIIIEIRKEQAGPRGLNKAIQIEVASDFVNLVEPNLKKLLEYMHSLDGLKDITDSRPVPGIEWQMNVDRLQASIYGADIQLVGSFLQLLTSGYKVSTYRPDDNDDEVDIVVRYPENYRSLSQAYDLMINTQKGYVPASYFVDFKPMPKVTNIKRNNGKRVLNASADVNIGILANDKIEEIGNWLKKGVMDERVEVNFKGDDEEQKKTQAFLMKAFYGALGLIAIILIMEFNSFYETLLILTAVIFSTIGVLLGLLITHKPFGIIMNGIGVIALAGVVVNHNIVLIDTYKILKASGNTVIDAVLRTCAQRIRPVMLTTVTSVLGLLPMVFGISFDFITADNPWVSIGAPSTQWWQQLSISIAFGLVFASFLTLILTPAMLVLGEKIFLKLRQCMWLQKCLSCI